MKGLRIELFKENVGNVDKIVEVVEEYLSEKLRELDDQASVLCEKYDGDSELTHYYSGQGMAYRNFADDVDLIVSWNPKHYGRFGDYE